MLSCLQMIVAYPPISSTSSGFLTLNQPMLLFFNDLYPHLIPSMTLCLYPHSRSLAHSVSICWFDLIPQMLHLLKFTPSPDINSIFRKMYFMALIFSTLKGQIKMVSSAYCRWEILTFFITNFNCLQKSRLAVLYWLWCLTLDYD